MEHQPTLEQERVRALAHSLDCLPEDDVGLLAKVTQSTLENWRKRGTGPAYVLIGNRYLYPRAAVAAFIQSNVRERRVALAKEML